MTEQKPNDMESTMTEQTLELGLVQMHSKAGEREQSVAKAVGYIEDLAERGAELVVIPEFFNTEYFYQYRDAKYLDLAEPEDGPSLTSIREVATARSIHVVATLLEEQGPGMYYDTAFLIGPDGSTVGKYRKVHPGGSMSFEKFYFRGGNVFPVWDVKGFKVSAIICYDHFFPEAARCSALNGAELVVGPFAAPGVACPWDSIMVTRAFENGVYMAPTNKAGTDGEWTLGGNSLVVSPRGEILARASADTDDTLLVTISREEVNLARRRFPMLRDRRPDAYATAVTSQENDNAVLR